MRVVLDSSVLVAACVARAGVCAELLEDTLGRHRLFVSQFILDEVARSLTDKIHYSVSLARQFGKLLRRASTCVEPASVPKGACRDANDLPILGTAIAARAQLLVTVDQDLLVLNPFRGIPIVKPREFWRRTLG